MYTVAIVQYLLYKQVRLYLVLVDNLPLGEGDIRQQ